MLPMLSHMEHGIKVNNDKVIMHKYNFGMYNFDYDVIYNSLISVGYSKQTSEEIIDYIKSSRRPCVGFGIEGNYIEFYVECRNTIRSWNLSTGIMYWYTRVQLDHALTVVEQNTSNVLYLKFMNMVSDASFVYTKDSDDIFNFYYKIANPTKTSLIHYRLQELLNCINSSDVINEYLNNYSEWYLHWIHISKKKDGGFQITPYFRNKI